MMGGCLGFTLFVLLVHGVFGDVYEVKSVEGDSVTLNTGVNKGKHDVMRWYFNDVLIALINGDPSTSCLYDGEGGRFRDRLRVDYETGSLNITNIRTEHTGQYEAQFIKEDRSGKTGPLNTARKCNATKISRKNGERGEIIKTFTVRITGRDFIDPQREIQEQEMNSGLSPGVIAGICVAVLLVFVAVGVVVFYLRPKMFRKEKEKSIPEHQKMMPEQV